MTADHLSYKRATSVSLLGLAIQAILAVILTVYGVIGSDAAAVTGGLAVLLGIPIWFALALVFHQHRLERLEALEAEAYQASTAAQASVFEEVSADLRSHAIRLAWMHKWFLPGVSLVVMVAYAAVGLLRFLLTRGSMLETPVFNAPTQPGWAISIGVGVAVIGFIFARFVAGMAKQRAWILLHAGSASIVGAALIGAAIAIGHFVQIATRDDTLLRYIGPAIAIFMMLLAVEMLLSFVLNLYRPRKAGEVQRPAFDSRILAFIAAPDRLAESISEAINYQFGFNVSSTWFYRLLARSVLSLIVLGVLVLWSMTVFTVVRPNERGLLIRNGHLVREVSPGLVVDLPWPWSRVERFPAESVTELHIGSAKPSRPGPILWTNQHTEETEKLFIVQPTGAGGDRGAGTDFNLLAAEFPVHYVIDDLVRYKNLAQDGPRDDPDKVRRDLLRARASSEIIQVFSSFSIDRILGPARRDLPGILRGRIQAAFNALGAPDPATGAPGGAGVRVVFVGISGVHPEQSVAPAFEEVVAADQKRLAEIERAQADATRSLAEVVGSVDRARSILDELDRLEQVKSARAGAEAVTAQELRVIELIIDAGGEASSLVSDARAARWTRHMGARARVAASTGLIASYRAAPGPFRIARYIEALRAAAADSRVIISPFADTRVRLNKEELEPLIRGFDPGPEVQQ